MTPEQAAAFIVAQAAMLNARIAGMVAENMQRAALGHSMAYGADEFFAVEREFDNYLGYNAVVALFHEANLPRN